jgi:hypothetical protein
MAGDGQRVEAGDSGGEQQYAVETREADGPRVMPVMRIIALMLSACESAEIGAAQAAGTPSPSQQTRPHGPLQRALSGGSPASFQRGFLAQVFSQSLYLIRLFNQAYSFSSK